MMRRPREITRLGAALLILASPGAAQDARLHTEVDVTETTVGGQFTLVVAVEHAAGTRVVFPDSLDLSPFEVLSLETGDPVPEGGRFISVGRYTLTVFELGELEIPSFEVALIDAAGTATTLDTSPWGVVVESVGRDESGDIRDVKAPFEIPLGSIIIAAWILGILLLAALLWWLYRRHRSQHAAGPIDLAAPIRRPWEIAEDALRELEAAGLVERGELKEYYVRVSEIVRAYVEAQFHVPALEMASFEVVAGLERVGLDRPTLLAFEGFLAECDLVKFAKFRPEAGRAHEGLTRAWRLVERTKVGRPAPPSRPTDPAPAMATATTPQAQDPADRVVDVDDLIPGPNAMASDVRDLAPRRAAEAPSGGGPEPGVDELVPDADAPDPEREGPA